MRSRRNASIPALLLVLGLAASQSGLASELEIERLTWSGIKLVSGNTTVFVDAVGTDLWDGQAPEGLVPVTADTRRVYALITHAHNDHFDLATLKSVLGEKGYVICHESIATYIASRGLRVIPAKFHTPVSRGGFLFTAIPAEDGFGDEQVSWVITSGDKRIFHGGDTLWHGGWRLTGQQYGPFDVTFLPVNGARVAGEPMVNTPAVMTPSQAADAAVLLRSKLLVPIHYGLNDPPHYVEVADPVKSVLAEAGQRGIEARHVMPGGKLSLTD